VSDGHGFRWENGSMIDLGCLAGATFCEALGVNDEGDVVVGTAQFPGDEDLGHPSFAHAFAWRDGTIQDLNALIDPASGWTLEKATGVNESGQIVGQGRVGNSLHSFLLTPR
jgi:probable HAF family extracellular repeat protein